MTAGRARSPDPPNAARELENTTTGVVPSARHGASSDSVPRRFDRRPRSKSASHSALTAAARWKITSAPARVSGPEPAGSSRSPRSPWIPATRSSAARSPGAGVWSTSVTRDSGRAPLPATSSDPVASRARARREPRKPEPPVTTPFDTASPVSVSQPEPSARRARAVERGAWTLRYSGPVQGIRAVLHGPGWLVGRDDDTGGRRRAGGRPEGRRRRPVAEELLSRAEVHGKEQQAVLVDEVMRDEGLRELAAAVDLQLVSRPLLELGDLGGQVAAEQRGVVPADGVERRGGHVLRQRGELARDLVVRVGYVRPVGLEDLVRPAAEEERVRGREPGPHGLPEVLVAVRERPSAVLETAVAVPVRAAGRLHDAVEREEGVQGQ